MLQRRNYGSRWLGLAIVGVASGIAGCPVPTTPGENEVLMQGIAFDPATITITAGVTVTWINQDFVPHTVTSGSPEDEDAGSVFESGTMLRGDTYSRTFDDVGEFVYFCEIHPNQMRDARVIVEAP